MSDTKKLLNDFLKARKSKDLWYNFDSQSFETDADIRTMVKNGQLPLENVSSEPDIFPIFGDTERAVKYYLPLLAKYVESHILAPEVVSAKDLVLYKGLYGFHNPSNYCFMDSVLLAMFALQGSPFYTNLIDQDYRRGPELICGKNRDEDERIRRQIQEQLREDVGILISGQSRHTCSTLRNLIGRDCRVRGAEDMSKGYQDASQLYSRLMSALNYTPLTFSEFKESQTEDGRWLPRTDQRPIEGTHLTVRVDSTDRISWPTTWNTGETQRLLVRTTKILVRDRVTILRADVIVVHLDRSKFGEDPEFSQVKKVPVDDTMLVELGNGEEREYRLQAVVYTPRDGHYHCMIRSQGKWYDYNDLTTTKIIEMTPLKPEIALTRIETRGAMFFYF